MLSGKKDKLSWYKWIFDQIKGNLTEIEPKNHQNVQETAFLQKARGFNGLKELNLYCMYFVLIVIILFVLIIIFSLYVHIFFFLLQRRMIF